MFRSFRRHGRARDLRLSRRDDDESEPESDIDEPPSPPSPKPPPVPGQNPPRPGLPDQKPSPPGRPAEPQPEPESSSSSSISSTFTSTTATSTSTSTLISTSTFSSESSSIVTSPPLETSQPPFPGLIPIQNPGTPQPATSSLVDSSSIIESTSTSTLNLGSPLRIPSSTFTTSTRTPAASATQDLAGLPTDNVPDVIATKPSGPQPGAKAGIAVGSIAGAALLISILFLLWRRSQTRKSRRSVLSEMRPAISAPTPGAGRDGRTDSQILADLMATAHAHQNGNASSSATSSTDEKGTVVVNVAENAQIRSSIASWLRRHHPLQLNDPAAERASLRSVSRGGSEGGSGPGTPRTPRTPGTAGSVSPVSGAGSPGHPPSPGSAGAGSGRLPPSPLGMEQGAGKDGRAEVQGPVLLDSGDNTTPSEGTTSIVNTYGVRSEVGGVLSRDLTGPRRLSQI
ncbi:hypothetical protein QBC47DRAFT_432561 [Echria macrotheca]|uniref:Uncharacterized protein n=1 Tax=Echria macrotheca TaxID=438768 RepID=A0AAJ0F3Y6_9PEZI|nr:hypothetical protein QBC47DRAFT_432561 [Echria macrotheca]